MSARLTRIRGLYRSLAVLFFNTFLLLLAVNLGLAIVYGVKDRRTVDASDAGLTESGLFYAHGGAVDNGKRSPSDLAVFDVTAFEDSMSEQEIAQMLDENYECFDMGIGYQPWVQYARKPFNSQFLNIDNDAVGIPVRRTVNPPRPDPNSAIRIFSFGGSTTFGLKTPDEHTWPSQLSQLLNQAAKSQGTGIRVEVTNYGRVGYMPTQEMIMLLDLLRSGRRPDIVIFLDGVNWGGRCDVPDWTFDFQDRVENAQNGQMPDWYHRIAIVRFATSIGNRMKAKDSKYTDGGLPDVDHAVQRFTQSRETIIRICDQYGVQPLFFLQPDGFYNYPAELHRASALFDGELQHKRRSEFYAELRKTDGYIDLTGLFEKWGRKAVIDAAHYSPQFNRFVAEHIAKEIDLETIDHRLNSEVGVVPTGAPRMN